jgi:hypothetical protein
MQEVAHDVLGLDVVPWDKIPTTLEALDAARDAHSVQAAKNGCGDDKPREGIILRPLIELTKNNGNRIIAKHKSEPFSERATPQKVVDPEKLKVLFEAKAIANEWVTEMRLTHVLDKFKAGLSEGEELDIRHTGQILRAMVEDVFREAAGEIAPSKDAKKAISARAAKMFKARLHQKIKD